MAIKFSKITRANQRNLNEQVFGTVGRRGR